MALAMPLAIASFVGGAIILTAALASQVWAKAAKP
jgi:hypothetical protein